MSAITVGSDLVHYEVLGRGRPVILLHSWVGSWRYWVPTLQNLQLKYRVYALDFFGFGDTGKNPDRYSLEQQISLLENFMRLMGLPKAAIIGHGLGALIGAEFGRRFPDKVARLCAISAPLYNPGHLDKRTPTARKVMVPQRAAMAMPQDFGPNSPTVMSASAAMREALRDAVRAKESPALATDSTIKRSDISELQASNPLEVLMKSNTLETLLGKCFRRNEETYQKLAVDIVKTDPRAVRSSVDTFDAGYTLDIFRLLPMPTLVLHGVDDSLIPVPDEEVWNYLTIDKEQLLLPIQLENVRHFPMLESDQFLQIANDFLEFADISKIELKGRWRRRSR